MVILSGTEPVAAECLNLMDSGRIDNPLLAYPPYADPVASAESSPVATRSSYTISLGTHSMIAHSLRPLSPVASRPSPHGSESATASFPPTPQEAAVHYYYTLPSPIVANESVTTPPSDSSDVTNLIDASGEDNLSHLSGSSL